MTQEEKQLLLKDLCARFPYGVICKLSAKGADISITEKLEGGGLAHFIYGTMDVKPYLRPMSSMTEEEWKEFSVFIGRTERHAQQVCLDADSMANPIIGGFQYVYWGLFDKCIDWLNAHHFDYRGLIEKGLALEAPEEMYKTE